MKKGKLLIAALLSLGLALASCNASQNNDDTGNTGGNESGEINSGGNSGEGGNQNSGENPGEGSGEGGNQNSGDGEKGTDAPAIRMPDKFFIQYKTITAFDEEFTFNLVKVDNTFVFYFVNGNGRITAQEVLEDGVYKTTEFVVNGKTNANYWSNYGSKTSAEINDLLVNSLNAKTYLDLIGNGYTQRVPSKDKSIAGVACQAYVFDDTLNNIHSVSEFYVDPNTNIVFYGSSSATVDGETVTSIGIDVQAYTTEVNSLYDYACESLMYRTNGTDTSNDTHHHYGEEKVLKEATCSNTGQKGKVCDYCHLPQVTETIPVDPNNHVPSKWYSDYEGNHYRECELCYEKLVIEPHSLPDLSEYSSCSGFAYVKCTVCENEVETEVTKSAEHTYNINNAEVSISYVSLNSFVTIAWHCDCWFLSSWSRDGDPGDDIEWVWDLEDTTYFTLKNKSGGYEVTVKKDACVAKIKEFFPQESDENILKFLNNTINNTAISGYNYKFNVYL